MEPTITAAIVGLVCALLFSVLWFRSRRQVDTMHRQHRQEIDELGARYRDAATRMIGWSARNNTDELRNTQARLRDSIEAMEDQIAIFDDRMSYLSVGLYEPKFGFADSEELKQRLVQIKLQQRQMIADHAAILHRPDPAIGDVSGQIRLGLRAFNHACDAALTGMAWNNAAAMELRITVAAAQIDQDNAAFNLVLNGDYVALRLEELRLTHELREKQRAERAERDEVVQAERDERRLQNEAAIAERRAGQLRLALEKLRASPVPNDDRIAELRAELSRAENAADQARAMAEELKQGYVYVLSNVGAFGEDVFMIGMTRRSNPEQRLREFDDVNVPFDFDLHALIHSDDAPALRDALHGHFASRRINTCNLSREFFAVSAPEIQSALTGLAPEASFAADREAREWHQTLAGKKPMPVLKLVAAAE